MKPALKLLGIGAGSLCVALAMVPWKLRGEARSAEIATHISKATGLTVRVGGQITLKLLPRPRVQMTDVSIRDANGALSADAPALYGDLDIPALFKGGWRLVSATLAEPTVTFNLDKVPLATILAGAPRTDAEKAFSPSFKLSFRSGVIRLRSARPGSDTLITDVNATAHQGPSADGSLAISGSAVWHAALGQFTARVGHPRAVLDGGSSAAFLQITSSMASFSAVGDLSGGTPQQFAGRVALSSNALPRLFSALTLPSPWLNVQKLALSGDALAKFGDVSLSGSTLRLDDTVLEGTLGFHTDGGRGLIEGTLATDFLDLGRLAGRELNRQTAARLYRTPLGADLLPTNIDLRVSASVARWGAAEVQDAALSALSHDGRVEVTLDEASAFNGIFKAHAVANVGAAGVEAHADVSVSNVDLGPLSTTLVGEERATGALTGKLAVEGRGQSLSDIVQGLSGDGQATVRSGNFMGLSVTQALKRFTRKLPPSDDHSAQITTFDSASSAIRVVNGVVNLVDGRVTGPGIQLSFGGHTDLPGGKIDILAVAAQTDAAGSLVPGGARLPFEMRGAWGEPFMLVEHTRALTLPTLPMPMIDPSQVLH